MQGTGEAVFRFHGDVRQFLSPGNRRGPRPARAELARMRETGVVPYPVTRRASLKDAVEALGVPHTEVGALLVDGEEAPFSALLAPGGVVDVHPVPAPFDVTAPSMLRPVPLPRVAFIVDANVGRLASLLRLLGLDAAYRNHAPDAEIAARAERERRIVLTRDRTLLHRSRITHARLLRAGEPKAQLVETLDFFGLAGPFEVFTRCLHCNDHLVPVPKAEILHRLQPLTKRHYHDFHTCPACRRIYWRGSHHTAMMDMLRGLGVVVAAG